jgi:geranylgeranyl transferase type-2 subunit alpha
MHGRKKPDQPRSATEVSTLQQKADLLLKSFSMVLDRRIRRDHSEESLELASRVLRTNPDFYTAWNFRRDILVDTFGFPKNKCSERLSSLEISSRELKLTEDCIRKNPKSCKKK